VNTTSRNLNQKENKMSKESKKAVLARVDKPYNAGDMALKIAADYAASANAKPEFIPQLIEDLAHLFMTGEMLGHYE